DTAIETDVVSEQSFGDGAVRMAEFDAQQSVLARGEICYFDCESSFRIGHGGGGRRVITAVMSGFEISNDAVDGRRADDCSFDPHSAPEPSGVSAREICGKCEMTLLEVGRQEFVFVRAIEQRASGQSHR